MKNKFKIWQKVKWKDSGIIFYWKVVWMWRWISSWTFQYKISGAFDMAITESNLEKVTPKEDTSLFI